MGVIAYYADHFVLPLPAGHRFPMAKYRLLRERIGASDLTAKLSLRVPDAAREAQLRRVHSEDYLQRVITGKLDEKEIRRIGFPWSPGLVERSRRSVGGSIAAAGTALDAGLGINLAGGTHHAYADHGEGFCVFNDVAVACREMQATGRIKRALIVDCDVHQGNGSAAIFREDPSVYTFSIHGEKNFPFHKEPSDLDIALPDGAQDQAYLEVLETGLARAVEESRADMAFYLAGADPFHDDRLGRLSLSKAGLAQRDRLVLRDMRAAGLPLAVVMSGGYARNVADTVDIHFQTISIFVKEFIDDHL